MLTFLGYYESMNPGSRLRAMRDAICLTQKQLGKIAGIASTRISNLETGAKNFGPSTRIKLAKAFNMTTEDFVRAIHSDKKTAAFWARLHQMHADNRDILIDKVAEALERTKDSPALFDHLISNLNIFIDLAKKVS